MQTVEPGIHLLRKVSALNERFIRQVSDWIENDQVAQLAHRHAACAMRREVNMGFNLFHLISDVYHRENLHSDIMQAIIDPAGSHGHGDIFLRLFLKFLRECHGVDIEIANYSSARLFREAGRIDLLIRDDNSKRAIIVENKINGAADMDRQLVRYLENVTSNGEYTCDAIVYLCLNQKKHPATPGWTDKEREKVDALLQVVCAYDESEGDLYHGWLLPCCESSTEDEVAHVLRQYHQLILKLGRNLMNKPIMEKFYDLMRNKQHHDSAVALTAMMSDLPAFRCQRVMDAFRHDTAPFRELWLYKTAVAVFEGFGEGNIKVHVDCTLPDCTKVQFFNNENDPESILPRRILVEVGMLDQFTMNQGAGWFTRVFLFPAQEDELYQFIRDFKSALTRRLTMTDSN
jgi:PD-(D/E)XK nuclease superfamily